MTDHHAMTFQEARDALEALALDLLDPVEKEAVLSFLERSPDLRAELEALEGTVGELSWLVRPAPIEQGRSDRIRSRLMNRAATDHGHSQVLRPTPSSNVILMPYTTHPTGSTVHVPSTWLSSMSSWIAMAASILAIVMSGLWYQATEDRDRFATAYSTISNDRVSGASITDSLRQLVQDREKMIASLTGPQVQVITLAANATPSMSARMFWDQSVNAWTFIAHNVPAPKAGRIYQLWLVTANQKINAGTFKPNASGDVSYRATYSLPREALAAVAVTDEPGEGSLQPTTVPFIVGSRTAK